MISFKRVGSLIEQFPALALDRPQLKELKSEEEMKRHTVDFFLESKPIERALHLLTVGEEVQRLSVIHSLPQLLQQDEPQCMQRVIPKVQQVLPGASAEFHLAASSTFLTILEKKLVHPRTFTQTFLQSILSSIDSRDPVVSCAWLETLLDVIDLLPASIIKSDILPVAIAKGQISQPVSSRIMSCKLLGKIATKFEPYLIKKEILPLIHSLCQDVSYEVRACICSQFHFFAKALDVEAVQPALLPILVELASDEESLVRLQAVETIVNMLPHLQPEILKYTVIPLVKKMCEQSLRAEDAVMVKIAEHFGRLCLGLDNYLMPQEKLWMLKHYQKMAQLGLPQLMKQTPDYQKMPDVVPPANTENQISCRQNCAYNFPAMVRFWSQSGNVDSFVRQLYTTFQELANDPYFMIRRTIACGFNEIVMILGQGSQVLRPELIKLLRDDAEEVLQGLVPHLGTTLVQLSKSGVMSPETMDPAVFDIGRALLKCEAEISITNNWRLHAMMLGQLECLPHCMPSDFIHSHFVPVVFNRIHTARPVPCRMSAVRTMLVFLRYSMKQIHKNAIRSRFESDLRQSDSCYKRMLYAKMCATAIDLFSRSYFKEFFFLRLLELSEDQVANIRLKLVTLLPSLKMMIYLPSDRKLLTALETCIRKLLMHEKDRDVMSQLRITIQALDNIEIKMDTVLNSSPTTKENLEDQRKAEEEAKLLSGGLPSVVSKRKPAVEPKRRSDPRSSPSVTERRLYPSSIPAVSARPGTSRVVNPQFQKEQMSNLEDEFYVDAGIRIPQQLATSDLSPLPSRIPNLREILFKNRNPPNTTNVNSENIAQSLSQKELRSESKSPESGNGNVDSKQSFGSAHKMIAKAGTTSSVSKSPVSVTPKKTFIPSNINKRNSGVFSTKTDYQSQQQQTPKSKLTIVNKQKSVVNTTDNRRHSYMEGDRLVKVKSVDISDGKKGSTISENRRHSYLAQGVEDGMDSKKGMGRCQNMNETKLATNAVGNRRHSYNPSAQGNRGDSEVPVLRRGAASNRHSIGPESRKSMINSQGQPKRGTSLDRETGTDSGNAVKRRSLIAPTTVKHSVRRHSSLERDDMDRMGVRTRVQSKRVESKFLSSNVQKELMIYSTDKKTANENVNIRKTECSRSMQREFHSLDDVGTSLKAGRTSKIPRGGGTSCHSSPGNSRASSPTIMICTGSSRLRQRTAPNSRASSPTGSEKLQQRLSLGSLNSYMGSLRLSEPGTSRLPVRNFSRQH